MGKSFSAVKWNYEDVMALKEILAILADFFKGDDSKVNLWLDYPNPLLGNITPMQMIDAGRARKLLRCMNDWRLGNLA